MLLPGNLMTHRQYEKLVPMLEKDYHIITVSFDGFDETGETMYATFSEGIDFYINVSKWEPNTDIPFACWYGENESNMKKAIKELQRAFPNIEIHSFKGLGHGEIVNNEEVLIKELETFMKKNSI